MKVSGSLLLVLFIQSHSLMLMVLCICVYECVYMWGLFDEWGKEDLHL